MKSTGSAIDLVGASCLVAMARRGARTREVVDDEQSVVEHLPTLLRLHASYATLK
jgi:hypothetical protein